MTIPQLFTAFLIVLSIFAGYSHQSQQLLDVIREIPDSALHANQNTANNEDRILKAVEHLEQFHEHYVKKMNEKFVNILEKIGDIDVNIKILQEKALVWNIFSHHVDKWIHHSKQVDQKIDSLKRSQETLPIMNNQLQNTDFKVQQIFLKVERINEKLNSGYKSKCSPKKNKNLESLEDFDESEIMSKLNMIQRMVQQIQRHQTSNPDIRFDKNSEFFRTNSKIRSSRETTLDREENELKDMVRQLQNSIEKIPIRDIKQSYNLNRKQEKSIDNLGEVLRKFEEETVRNLNENVAQVEKLQVASYNNHKDLIGWTKKIEDNCMMITTTEKADIKHEREQQGSGEELSGDQSSENNDFQHPDKSYCYQLKSGQSGLYTFGQQQSLNNGGRDFNQQYCDFATDGPAWLVLQRRGDYQVQENFNRSWNEYKLGFGDMYKDFWIGNDFIHKLTYQENMVLRVEFETFNGKEAWMEYSTFRIESEKFKYNLIVEGAKGSVSDGLLYHNDSDFSTFDQKNDLSNSSWTCSQSFGNAGWWFNDCAESCLNGVYQRKAENLSNMGIFWDNENALMSSKMMIRPRDSVDNLEFLEVTQDSSSEEP